MNSDKFGQLIFDENDCIDIIMSGQSLPNGILVNNVDISRVVDILENPPILSAYIEPTVTVEEFDKQNQSNWFMPEEYKQLDIAEYVLKLCNTDEQLQRCGQELLMYQERGLLELLKYLKYLIDTMSEHKLIWGLGRGSSVASYVLYLLKVHRIDSMYYNLDINEFLR